MVQHIHTQHPFEKNRHTPTNQPTNRKKTQHEFTRSKAQVHVKSTEN